MDHILEQVVITEQEDMTILNGMDQLGHKRLITLMHVQEQRVLVRQQLRYQLEDMVIQQVQIHQFILLIVQQIFQQNGMVQLGETQHL